MFSSATFKNARTQVVIVAFISFACPGMFNAMSGLGGAGSFDPTTANNANTALYACFAIFGYFGGMLFNLFGDYANRILMGVGGLAYVFYSVGQYVAGHDNRLNWLAILSGGVLGVGAGLFWTAQGAMMMAYAPEEKKGTYISIFWVIFNLGGLLGGILVFAVNFNNESGGANAATYFAFAAIMAIGAFSAFFLLVKPQSVIREDGKAVQIVKATGPMEELKNVALMFLDKHMLLLTPLFITSNFFYTYQFNAINGGLFSIRARGLNSALYWGSQMLGSWLFGMMFLDNLKMSRRRRAIWGSVILSVFFTVAWALGCYLQLGWKGGFDKNDRPPVIDLQDSGDYIYPFFVFILYGIGDAMLQTFAYWVMGAITNDLVQSARYTGYYKGIQSAGAAIAWQMDNQEDWPVQLFVNWALFTVTIPCTFYVVYKWVKDRTEDGPMVGAPETAADKSDGPKV